MCEPLQHTCSRTLRILSRRRHLCNDLSYHSKHAVWDMSRLLRLIRIIEFKARQMFCQIPALPSFLMQLLQRLFPGHMLKRLGARSTWSISSPHMSLSRLDLKLYGEAVGLLVQAKWHSWRRQSLKDCRCEVLSWRHKYHMTPPPCFSCSRFCWRSCCRLCYRLCYRSRTCSRPSCSIRHFFLIQLHVQRLIFLMFLHVRRLMFFMFLHVRRLMFLLLLHVRRLMFLMFLHVRRLMFLMLLHVRRLMFLMFLSDFGKQC